ncbi:MAG: hydantoinase/oxoprolinase family protein [Pseudomonadota bacterium]
MQPLASTEKSSSQPDAAPRLQVGIDIGGTFTDFALLAQPGDRLLIGKRLTTPSNPAVGLLQGLQDLLKEHSLQPRDVEFVVHATTLVTNTVLERNGAKVGLLATEGFRDILESGTEHRFDIYDLMIRLPEPLVPRRLRLPIEERVAVDGAVLRKLSKESVVRAAEIFKTEGVEAIAVSLLHSYANPAHEQEIAGLLEDLLPGVPVTLSSQLLPEIREYERTLTTVINAYVQPRVRDYLQKLKDALAELGVATPLYVMHSAGGLMSASQASRKPIWINESGPAAGALCAAHFGRQCGLQELISFDMGGTTAKTCLIREGQPAVATDVEIGRQERFKKGSGFPMKVPSVDLIEIGAGGGSIAHVDNMKLLKVGPASAGSEPGPVCYARGGVEPTVTDADLVLGFLDADHFLGGAMKLDLPGAQEAIRNRIAQPLNMETLDAAWGIHELVNENMATASRIHIVEKGADPRNFAMVAFGGAGPVHAYAVAQRLGASQLIFPVAAGAASALGLLLAPPATDLVQSFVGTLGTCSWSQLTQAFQDMEDRGLTQLSGFGIARPHVLRSLDLRCAGQGSEITVPVRYGELDASCLPEIKQAFAKKYEVLYGRRPPSDRIEVLNARLRVMGEERELGASSTAGQATQSQSAASPPRRVYFGPKSGFLDFQVVRRNLLSAGMGGVGPTLIQERESTLVVPPAKRWRVDAQGNVVVELRGEKA